MTTRTKSPLCEEVPVVTPADAPIIEAAVAAEIRRMESAIEAHVQATLDTMDAWQMTEPFNKAQKVPGTCTKEKHKCNLTGASTSSDKSQLCVGCNLHKNIVDNRGSFIVGGRTEVCDLTLHVIARPIITSFIGSGAWLSPLRESSTRWFVTFPVTYHLKQPNHMGRPIECNVTRNRVRLFDADALLRSLGIKDVEAVYKSLPDYWHTEKGGSVYVIQDLIELIEPISKCATAMKAIGFDQDESADIGSLMRKVSALKLE